MHLTLVMDERVRSRRRADDTPDTRRLLHSSPGRKSVSLRSVRLAVIGAAAGGGRFTGKGAHDGRQALVLELAVQSPD